MARDGRTDLPKAGKEVRYIILLPDRLPSASRERDALGRLNGKLRHTARVEADP